AGGQWEGAERIAAQTLPALRQVVSPGCFDVAAWFSADSETPVGRLLRAEADAQLGDAEFGADLMLHLESDLDLGCQSRWLGDLLYFGRHQPLLAGLASRMAPPTVERSSATLEAESTVALAVGRRERAIRLVRAAAAESPEPRELWQR